MTILAKKQMSEEDIKLNFITPALQKSWKDQITMETKVKLTDGKIQLAGNLVARATPKYADYLLYLNKGKPIAVVEAKDNNHSVSYGMQQAKEYAQMLDLPFAYSSNGDAFQEFDFLTGLERTIDLDKFPTQEELTARYYSESNDGKGFSELERKIIEQPYYTSFETYPPRYYQRNAINRTVEAIARGKQRLLLVMATGTGKTYTAFQIVFRLLKSKMKQRILYLADRNILVDQSILQDFAPLEKTIHKIVFSKDKPNKVMSYEVNFALYQQMVGKNEEEHYTLFPKDFFDLVIVDECHRGSAKEESNWRKVLEYFSTATQIGMTATPKETKYISSIDYFGEPIYTYSLKQGIDDGFLAPFKVINITTNIGDEWRPYKGQLDINGNEIPDRIYNNRDYDYNIIIQDRINEVAREITDYLKCGDRMRKTIVFCASEDHAERMRIALTNLNNDIVKEHPDYVIRITGSDDYGKSKLQYFISVSSEYPVIATTSELLSTGADCKMTKLIVLDKIVESMTTFKQIIGRGTRIREKEGKTHFVVMDFRNVSRLFSDPDWDGPIQQDNGFHHDLCEKPVKYSARKPSTQDDIDDVQDKPLIIVDPNGCKVKIINKTVSTYDTSGKLLRQENIFDYTKMNITGEFASLSDFINKWNTLEKKDVVTKFFIERGIDLLALKKERNMADVDEFDFICYLAYGRKALTRRERADNVKKRDFFTKYSNEARAVLDILLTKYANKGICEIEADNILSIPDLESFGKPAKIVKLFGEYEDYEAAIKELKWNIYNEA